VSSQPGNTIKTIGVLYHPKLPETRQMAMDLSRQLRGWGVTPWTDSAWDPDEVRQHLEELDLLITLGGDGTILRAARLGAAQHIPVLGVNYGRLGFLAEFQPEEVLEQLPLILDGRYWLEARMMLQVELARQAGSTGIYHALNDAVVGRGGVARVVRLSVHVNGERTLFYTADGLVVSTPTGSTAYSVAAGGPILDPQLPGIVVTPIAPHLARVHSLVLPVSAVVEVQTESEYPAVLSVDGQIEIPLAEGDRVVVKSSPLTCQFLHVRPPGYFYRTLAERLGLRNLKG